MIGKNIAAFGHDVQQLKSQLITLFFVRITETERNIPAKIKGRYSTVQPQTKKSNSCYTRGITLKKITSGEVHLRGLAPAQDNCEKLSQRWRVVVDTVTDLTGSGIEPQIFRTDSVALKKKGKGTGQRVQAHIV